MTVLNVSVVVEILHHHGSEAPRCNLCEKFLVAHIRIKFHNAVKSRILAGNNRVFEQIAAFHSLKQLASALFIVNAHSVDVLFKEPLVNEPRERVLLER